MLVAIVSYSILLLIFINDFESKTGLILDCLFSRKKLERCKAKETTQRRGAAGENKPHDEERLEKKPQDEEEKTSRRGAAGKKPQDEERLEKKLETKKACAYSGYHLEVTFVTCVTLFLRLALALQHVFLIYLYTIRRYVRYRCMDRGEVFVIYYIYFSNSFPRMLRCGY